MIPTPVSYVFLKSVFATLPYYYQEMIGRYDLFAVGNGGMMLTSSLVEPEDIEDFELNYMADGTSVISIEEALVAGIIANNALHVPRTSDGRTVNLPNAFTEDVNLYYAGAGDDPVLGRGEGQALHVCRTDAGDESVEVQFIDWLYFYGGGASYSGALCGDHVSFSLCCPATVVTPNAQNQGNCNIVNQVVIVPAAGDGAYDVDLENAANPVPASGAGFWEWSWPDTGRGVVTPGAPMGASYYLLAMDQPLIRYGAKLQLMGDHVLDLNVPNIAPKKVLPHWRFKITLHNKDGGHELMFSCYLVAARKVTL